MNTPSIPSRPHPGKADFPQCARGFSLIEMLVALSIVAVLAGVAAPSMSSIAQSIKLSSATNTFVSHLLLARSEAIKRNTRVVLCKSADGLTCLAGSEGWDRGLIIFQDIDNNAQLGTGEIVILRAPALPEKLRFVGNLNVARYVSFAPTGATKLVGGGFQAGTITLCRESDRPTEARQIVLNAVGRPRVQKARVASCA